MCWIEQCRLRMRTKGGKIIHDLGFGRLLCLLALHLFDALGQGLAFLVSTLLALG